VDDPSLAVSTPLRKYIKALVPIFPNMLGLTLVVIVVQVRSIPAMVMVVMTAPLGVVGMVPIPLIFHQPFGSRCDDYPPEHT
jgi:multidrug efflux pump subunit AcrB